jgi:hypothetical protein
MTELKVAGVLDDSHLNASCRVEYTDLSYIQIHRRTIAYRLSFLRRLHFVRAVRVGWDGENSESFSKWGK